MTDDPFGSARVLAYAHRKGSGLWTSSSAHIMLRDSGAADERVCLIDFGIAMLQEA